MINKLRMYKKDAVRYLLIKGYHKKINNIVKQHKKTLFKDRKYIHDATIYWKSKGYTIKRDWHIFYSSLNNIKSNQYVPEDIFYAYIEPTVNNLKLAKSYYDKNMYDIYFRDIKMPETVIHCIKGNIYDKQYQLIDDINAISSLLKKFDGRYFLKPSLESGIGKHIVRIVIKDGLLYLNDKLVSISQLVKMINGNFIIQSEIRQSKLLQKINPKSLNTIRSLSLRVNNEIKILSNIIRFGSGEAYVDNFNAGGIACSINENGQLGKYAYNKYYQKQYTHPNTKEPFESVQLPRFQELEKFIIKCHDKLPYFNMISWDIGLDEYNEYVLIECNLKAQSLNFHQVLNGPIFKNHIDDII